MESKTISLDTWEGHMVLMCKDWYIGDIDIFVAFRRLWEIRCGLPVGSITEKDDEFIANSLFEIIRKTRPNSIEFIHQLVHKGVAEDENSFFYTKPKGLTPLQRVMWEYCLIILQLQIRDIDKETGESITLVNIPKPQKRIIKRILRGKGVFADYELLTGKYKKELA